ncbi:chaperone modulator CbpM [Desulfofustis glycolicus]|nr:chaperone modulator CbpM [Desulfofustis glycolicus]MCB2215245.1 chaperone modulator CbpM [Desulfobulbaceae bacterium]
MMKRYELIVDERRLLTIEELGRLVDVHPDLLQRFVVYGLIDPEIDKPCLLFADRAIVRIRKIQRLRGDLGLNLAGCGVVLDLLDRIDDLEREIHYLRSVF